MTDKPSKPSGDWALKPVNYSEDGLYTIMTDNEFRQGRNMTGEIETPLGSVPNAHKDNWLFQYFTVHINYIEQMLDYLDKQISGGT